MVKFVKTEHDTQTGCATWEIRLEHDGVYEVVGTIEKDCVWCGDGYRADAYSVTVDREHWDDSKETSFQVANIWSKGEGMTARQAMAACKQFAREALRGGK